MGSKTKNKKRMHPQPYDRKLSEPCKRCNDVMVYRRSSYFGHKVYYKICNNCGFYLRVDDDEWREKVSNASEKKKRTA